MLCRILLVIMVTFCGASSMHVTTRFVEGSMIITLNLLHTNNITHSTVECLNEDSKILFYMHCGERMKSHKQFEGRVFYEYTETTVNLKLLNFTNDDEGTYLCSFYDGGDNHEQERFVLTGPANNMAPNPSTSGPGSEGTNELPVVLKKEHPLGLTLSVAAVVVVLLVVMAVVCHKARRHCQQAAVSVITQSASG